MTPRQTCPRPDGFGRNLRSKTRWFTGFCNSHQVSHFATFFIDARAEISVAESRYDLRISRTRAAPAASPFPGREDRLHSFPIPWRVPRRGSFGCRRRLESTARPRLAEGSRAVGPLTLRMRVTSSRVVLLCRFRQ